MARLPVEWVRVASLPVEGVVDGLPVEWVREAVLPAERERESGSG